MVGRQPVEDMVVRQRATTSHQRQLLTALRFSGVRRRLRVGRSRWCWPAGICRRGSLGQIGMETQARVYADLHHLKLDADQYLP